MHSHSIEKNTKKAPKSVFLATSVLLFFLSVSAADSIGFVPYYVDGSTPFDATEGEPLTTGGTVSNSENVSLANLPELGEEVTQIGHPMSNFDGTETTGVAPERISIPAIDLDLPVSNPETRDVEELDAVLKSGPARYVDSAILGESGNVLIFGHSSHLPIVHNQMYKAFNRVPELEAGDTITVTGGGKEYFYSVVSLRRADANNEQIDVSRTGNRLTVVTCDTLTSKSTRWIVEAELIGSY